MTAPLITHLPTSPNRLSRPSNFVNDSVVFLESLPTFRTEVNLLSSYINTNIPNKYNFGKLNGVRTFPVITQVGDYNIEYTGDGVLFTSDLDVYYGKLVEYSGLLNPTGIWFDSVLNEVGAIPYDIDKPMISGVTVPMSRTQSKDDFNTSGLSFGQSTTNNINSLYQSMYHTYMNSCGNKDFGSVTDTTIIKIIDGGSVADATLTY